jgi:hypothetical protein
MQTLRYLWQLVEIGAEHLSEDGCFLGHGLRPGFDAQP